MTLSIEQTNELLQIIDRNQLVAIGQQLGPEFLTLSDRQVLLDSGVDISRLYTPVGDTVFTQFHFGLLSEALGQTHIDALSYDQLREYIAKGRYIPLTFSEQAAINVIKRQTFNDLKKLNGKIFTDVNQTLIDNTLKTQKEFLRSEQETGIADKKTITEIAHTIAEKTGDWSRDFERIVAYNSHQAFEEGKAAMIERNSDGRESMVYKSVFAGACDHCIRLYLTNGIGSQPRLFKLSDLKANGTNIGRKTKEWQPVIGAVHPYCYDDKTEVLTNDGWKFFKDLDKTEKFLSVNLDTGDGQWLVAINWVEHKYKGPMYSFQNKNFDLVTSPNHHHVIKTYASNKLRLVETLKLPTQAQFLKHIPDWKGSQPVYLFEKTQFESKLFTKFLAYFLSEGSAIDYKGRLTLHISQSEEKYLQEIFDTCKDLFKVNVAKCKDYVQIMCTDKIELWNWLKSFGKSFEKRVPQLVKESGKELIEIFLQAYCQGDGSFRKGRKWDGYQCKDSREYHTSSKLMADDLGEMILKIGKCPLYRFKEPETIYDPKRKKSYTQNYGMWLVTECISKYAHKSAIKQEIIDYNGIIYDVELEKNHTLLIRRNGKVCISGNCRCQLHPLLPGWKWDQGKQQFISASDTEYKPKRKLIRVWISGQETFV